AIDRRTGRTVWEVDRKPEANWVSPIALEEDGSGQPVVLLQAPSGLSAHKASDGERLWTLEDVCLPISSSTAAGGVVYVPAKGLTALRPAGGTPQVLWSEANLAPGNSSPVICDGSVYVLNRAGALTAANAATGEVSWRLRLKGTYWATPVLANGRLYC